MKITVGQIDEMRAKLAALPAAPAVPTQPATKMKAVTALAPELIALRERGWGLHALAAFMTEGGFPISPGTLKNYLQRAGATRTKRRRKKEIAPSPATGATLPVAPRGTTCGAVASGVEDITTGSRSRGRHAAHDLVWNVRTSRGHRALIESDGSSRAVARRNPSPCCPSGSRVPSRANSDEPRSSAPTCTIGFDAGEWHDDPS